MSKKIFSPFTILDLAQINLRVWLTWFLQSCAENGGQVLTEIARFLSWNVSSERRRTMAVDSDDSS